MRSQASAAVMEALEPRTMLAGAVTVLFSPTQITITGGTGDDAVMISTVGGAGTQYTAVGQGATVVTTKGTAPVASNSVSIFASMGAGNDSLALSNVVAKNITFIGGAGSNQFTTSQVDVWGFTTVSLGTGTATGTSLAVLGRGVYVGAVTITGGNYGDGVGLGADSVYSGMAVFIGRVVVNTLGGSDILAIGTTATMTTTFNNTVQMLTGLGNDVVMIGTGTNEITFKGNTTLDLGAGNDTLNVDVGKTGSTVTFNGAVNRIALGTGDDTTGVPGGMRAGCIAFGASTFNTITGGIGTKSLALRLGLLQASINAGVKMISFSF